MSTTTLAAQKSSSAFAWKLTMGLLLGAFVMMHPDFAHAIGENTPIGSVFCKVSGWFTGNTGKGLATIAVTIIGIGALLGKVSWGMALIVGLGIALVFGASELVNAFGWTNIDSGCDTSYTFTSTATPAS